MSALPRRDNAGRAIFLEKKTPIHFRPSDPEPISFLGASPPGQNVPGRSFLRRRPGNGVLLRGLEAPSLLLTGSRVLFRGRAGDRSGDRSGRPHGAGGATASCHPAELKTRRILVTLSRKGTSKDVPLFLRILCASAPRSDPAQVQKTLEPDPDRRFMTTPISHLLQEKPCRSAYSFTPSTRKRF